LLRKVRQRIDELIWKQKGKGCLKIKVKRQSLPLKMGSLVD